MIDLSLVMPVFNGGAFLAHALKSVIEQTAAPAELIILDNASTDETPATIRDFLPRFACPVRVERNDCLLPSNENWAKAVNLVRTKYFAILPADDLLLPAFISEIEPILKNHPQVSLLLTAGGLSTNSSNQVRNESWTHPFPPGHVPSRDFLDKLVWGTVVPTCGIVYDLGLYKSLGGFDDRMPKACDFDLYLRAAAQAVIYYHPKALGIVRYHSDQGSQEMQRRDEGDSDAIFHNLCSGIYDHLTHEQERALLANMCYTRFQYFSYWLRTRGSSIAQVQQARRMGLHTSRRWRQTPHPLARHVRTSPASWKQWMGLWIGATKPGIWLMQRLVRKLPSQPPESESARSK